MLGLFLLLPSLKLNIYLRLFNMQSTCTFSVLFYYFYIIIPEKKSKNGIEVLKPLSSVSASLSSIEISKMALFDCVRCCSMVIAELLKVTNDSNKTIYKLVISAMLAFNFSLLLFSSAISLILPPSLDFLYHAIFLPSIVHIKK